MKSISKIYFIISFFVLLLLLGSIWFFNQESDKDKLQELRRFTVVNFEKEFEYERANLLNFALALSEDGALKEALLKEDQGEGYQLLYNISARFVKHTDIKKLRLQLITNDLEIFAQNWKEDNAGKPLRWFRKDLTALENNRRPKVGLETGRRLTFKATIPMKLGEQNIGYLEVIHFIDEFAEKLRQQGIELFALMDKEYIIDDSLMKEFPDLKEYIIANTNYNSKLKVKAESFSWKGLEHLGYHEHDETFFMLKEMLNAEGIIIGKYLIVLPKNLFLAYKKSYQNVSRITRFSDKDIYNYVKRWENSSGSYRTVKDRELLELLPKLHEEDKVLLKEAANATLQQYEQKELIDIILDNKYKEVKRGIIE